MDILDILSIGAEAFGVPLCIHTAHGARVKMGDNHILKANQDRIGPLLKRGNKTLKIMDEGSL